MSKEDIVKSARERFDKELHSDEYKKVHEDSTHLKTLIELCDIQRGDRILDIGTGNGYIAFELAKRYPNAEIIGLDIAETSIIKNNKLAEKNGIKNIVFISYDGIKLPFENASFTKIVSRYAFHHFPEPKNMLKDLYRTLAVNGNFIFSDALTFESDTIHFIDRFQELKKDGHVHFYHLNEIITLLKISGFKFIKNSINKISFPRDLNEDYNNLLASASKEIKNTYNIIIRNDKVFVTIQGFNIKSKKETYNQ